MLLFSMELLSQVTVVGVDLYAGGADAGDDVGDEEGQPADHEHPHHCPCAGAEAFLKGQSNEIVALQFFSTFEPVWGTGQWVKMFSNLVQFSRSYSKFRFKKTDSLGYDTPGSKKNCILGLQYVALIKNVAY